MEQEIKDRIEKIKKGEVPKGYRKTKAGLIPNHWNSSKAKNIFINYSNKKHNGDLEVLSATQDRGVIPRNELGIEIKFDKNSLKNYKKVEKGDFVISLRSFQGGIEYSDFEGLVSPAYTVLKENKAISKDFYKHFFKTEIFISKLNSVIYGIRDGKQVSYGDFSELYIQEPPLIEQQKIAKILSTWNKGIELKEKFIEEKKKQKKGLMQKLLTGEVRLPGFDGAWKEVKLENISSYESSNISISSLESYVGLEKYPVYSATGMFKFIDSYKMDVDYIAIVKDGAGAGRLSKGVKNSSIIGTMGYIVNNEDVDFEFLFQYMQLIDFTKYIKGSTIPHVYYKDYKNETILLPSSEEQRSISEILKIADKEISLLEEQLDLLKLQKKGLMQLLLTGIVRVNTENQ